MNNKEQSKQAKDDLLDRIVSTKLALELCVSHIITIRTILLDSNNQAKYGQIFGYKDLFNISEKIMVDLFEKYGDEYVSLQNKTVKH